MIYIDRDRTDSEGRPIQPGAAWLHRAHEATAKAVLEGRNHQILDNIYRDPSVRIALEALFHGKCAYCESPLNEVGWHVEHFRPKGGVTERPDHPGYYWLAYHWPNLYPSCAACNQHLEDKPRWQDPTLGETAGKANQFPVEVEANRAMTPNDDLVVEQPLLLDPCSDDPEDILEYTVEGEIKSTTGDRKVESSIQILHLTRRRLEFRRKQQIALVILLIRRLNDLKQSGDQAVIAEFELDLEQKIFSDSAPFAGAARFVRRDPEAFGV